MRQPAALILLQLEMTPRGDIRLLPLRPRRKYLINKLGFGIMVYGMPDLGTLRKQETMQEEEGSREWKGNNSVCKTGYKDRGNPPGCRTTSATYHRMVDPVGDFIEYGYKHRFHDPHARLTRTPWLQCAGRRLQADPPKRAAELAVVSGSSFDVSWWTHVAL